MGMISAENKRLLHLLNGLMRLAVFRDGDVDFPTGFSAPWSFPQISSGGGVLSHFRRRLLWQYLIQHSHVTLRASPTPASVSMLVGVFRA
jgi:hypothetical protein